MQVAESHGPALENVQAGFGQDGNHLAKIEINMVTEARDQAAPFICRSSKIDGKQSPTRLQNVCGLASRSIICVTSSPLSTAIPRATAPRPLGRSLAKKREGVNASRWHPCIPRYVLQNKITSASSSL